MEIDTSLTIVGIIAVVALLSPPITALIENLFKLISKWIDYRHTFYDNEYNHKRELFENFLNYAGQVTYDKPQNLQNLVHAYYVIVPYIPKNKLVFFREYCNLIQEESESNDERLTYLLHDKIIPCIKRELCRRKPLRK